LLWRVACLRYSWCLVLTSVYISMYGKVQCSMFHLRSQIFLCLCVDGNIYMSGTTTRHKNKVKKKLVKNFKLLMGSSILCFVRKCDVISARFMIDRGFHTKIMLGVLGLIYCDDCTCFVLYHTIIENECLPWRFQSLIKKTVLPGRSHFEQGHQV